MRRPLLWSGLAVAAVLVVVAAVRLRSCAPPAPAPVEVADRALAAEADAAAADEARALADADAARALADADLEELGRRLDRLRQYADRAADSLDSLATRVHAFPADSLAAAADAACARRGTC